VGYNVRNVSRGPKASPRARKIRPSQQATLVSW